MKTDRPLKEFVAEAEDLLESASQALLSIEAGLSAGGVDPDTVNGLFRDIHSFKGLAGIFGLKEPSELAHRMETLLDAIRLGRVSINSDVLDALFESASVLSRLVRQAAEREPFEDITDMLSALDVAVRSAEAPPADRSILSEISLDASILKALTEYEERRLIENIQGQKNILMIKASYELANFEDGIKKLNALLKKHGEIICTLPTSEGGTGISFSIVVGTKENAESLRSAVRLPNVVIEQVPTIPGKARPSGQKTEKTGLKSASNTVRVDISKLDGLMNVVGDLHLAKNAVSRIARELSLVPAATGYAADLNKVHRNLERKLNELQAGILDVRMVPIGQIFTRLRQMVRKYVHGSEKEIDLELMGEETELDKVMIEDLADPLMHLIHNAIDHGVEPPEERKRLGKPPRGVVRVSAYPKGNQVVITVEDDGKGMDPRVILSKAVEKGLIGPHHGLDPELDKKEILDLIFLPGFSTKEIVTEISGRGVGLDVVKKHVSKLSGLIDIETRVGEGTKYILTLPITLAIIKALVVEAGGRVFSIPLGSVLEIVRAIPAQIQTVESKEVMLIRDETVPLLRLSRVFGLPDGDGRKLFYVILTGLAERRLGIVVDRLRDQQDIVIKPIGKRFANTVGIAGATELSVGERRVVLVLDVESILEAAFKKRADAGGFIN